MQLLVGPSSPESRSSRLYSSLVSSSIFETGGLQDVRCRDDAASVRARAWAHFFRSRGSGPYHLQNRAPTRRRARVSGPAGSVHCTRLPRSGMWRRSLLNCRWRPRGKGAGPLHFTHVHRMHAAPIHADAGEEEKSLGLVPCMQLCGHTT